MFNDTETKFWIKEKPFDSLDRKTTGEPKEPGHGDKPTGFGTRKKTIK